MAIVEFINKPNRTYAGMRSVINYVLNPDKTNDTLTSGIGVNPANSYNEMVALKQIMGKTDKRLWYHFVQSFPPYDNITPELALEIALKTAEYWKDEYQILVAVHTDKEHTHTHFVLNTVNIETGKKYTQNNEQRIEIQAFSDRICEEYGLHVLSEAEKNKSTYKKPGQYRTERKGEGWKADLIHAIDTALHYATGKGHFIKLMNAQGYKVKWEDSRQNITFTTSSGMKCRDRKLGDSTYYCKSNFEMIFEQNAMGNTSTNKLPKMLELMQKIGGILQFNPADNVDFSIPHISFDGLSYEEMEALAHWLKSQIESKKAQNEWKQQSQKLNSAFEQLEELLEMAIRFTEQNRYNSEFTFDNEFER